MSNQITPLPATKANPLPYTAVPKDIFLWMLSFLGEKELIIANYVCKAWKELVGETKLFEKANVRQVYLKTLFEKGTSSSLFEIYAPSVESLLYADKDRCIFQGVEGGLLKVYEKNGNSKGIEGSARILGEAGNIVFVSEYIHTNLKGLDRVTGSVLFTVDASKIPSYDPQNIYGRLFNKVHVTSRNPLTFITVMQNGVLAKWILKDGVPEFVAENSFSHEHGLPIFSACDAGYIYVASQSVNEKFYSIYAQDTLEKIDSDHDFSALIMHIFSAYGLNMKTVIGSQFIVHKGFAGLVSFNLKDGQINWERSVHNSGIYITARSQNWIVLTYESKAGICSTDGQKYQHVECLHKINQVKISGQYVCFITNKGIGVFDAQESRFVIRWELNQEKLKIQSVYFSGWSLFVHLKDEEDNVFVKQLSFMDKPSAWTYPSLATQTPKKKEESSMQCLSLKTAAIACGILAGAFFSGALAAYYCGAINLSIGLGVASLLSLGGVLIAGHRPTNPLLARHLYV